MITCDYYRVCNKKANYFYYNYNDFYKEIMIFAFCGAHKYITDTNESFINIPVKKYRKMILLK